MPIDPLLKPTTVNENTELVNQPTIAEVYLDYPLAFDVYTATNHCVDELEYTDYANTPYDSITIYTWWWNNFGRGPISYPISGVPNYLVGDPIGSSETNLPLIDGPRLPLVPPFLPGHIDFVPPIAPGRILRMPRAIGIIWSGKTPHHDPFVVSADPPNNMYDACFYDEIYDIVDAIKNHYDEENIFIFWGSTNYYPGTYNHAAHGGRFLKWSIPKSNVRSISDPYLYILDPSSSNFPLYYNEDLEKDEFVLGQVAFIFLQCSSQYVAEARNVNEPDIVEWENIYANEIFDYDKDKFAEIYPLYDKFLGIVCTDVIEFPGTMSISDRAMENSNKTDTANRIADLQLDGYNFVHMSALDTVDMIVQLDDFFGYVQP